MFNVKDVKFEATKGSGPGGQHKNKTFTAIRATHVPTNIVVFIQNERSQSANKRAALRILKAKVSQEEENRRAKTRKECRDKKIKDRTIIRTYDFTRGVVKDHRSDKTASLKAVLKKGRIDFLRPTQA